MSFFQEADNRFGVQSLDRPPVYFDFDRGTNAPHLSFDVVVGNKMKTFRKSDPNYIRSDLIVRVKDHEGTSPLRFPLMKLDRFRSHASRSFSDSAVMFSEDMTLGTLLLFDLGEVEFELQPAY